MTRGGFAYPGTSTERDQRQHGLAKPIAALTGGDYTSSPGTEGSLATLPHAQNGLVHMDFNEIGTNVSFTR